MTDELPELSLVINLQKQELYCYAGARLKKSYPISTGKNGIGELKNSGCTPRGWHQIHKVIGLDAPENAVFVGRVWTGEIFSPELYQAFPDRDWILTRILQLDGLEPGLNRGGEVDSLERYIYIHGTPDHIQLGIPGSKGCVRMKNRDIMELASWVQPGVKLHIKEDHYVIPF